MAAISDESAGYDGVWATLPVALSNIYAEIPCRRSPWPAASPRGRSWHAARYLHSGRSQVDKAHLAELIRQFGRAAGCIQQAAVANTGLEVLGLAIAEGLDLRHCATDSPNQ